MHEMETFMLKLCMVPFKINCTKTKSHQGQDQVVEITWTKQYYFGFILV